MSQALYRKWRPHLWDEVVGQDHVIHTLQNAIHSGRVGHAYLFSGPRGTGKTTTARLLAKAVNCLEEDITKRPCDHCEHCIAVNEGRFLDLIEIDAASNTSVDDVRDLREKINFSPSQGRYKVYIIDEVHMLSTAAFNALLKTLEEPPAHAIFILATTEVHKIPATILSRCQRHEFRRIPVEDIIRELKLLAEKEKIKISDDALLLIARQSTGSMRDAISLLDQLASTGDEITLSLAQNVLGTATSQTVVNLIAAILARQPADGLSVIHQALDGGTDPRQLARQIVDYLRSLMLVRLGNAAQIDATGEQKKTMEQQAGQFQLPHLLETLKQFNLAASDTRGGWQPGLLLELALAESISAGDAKAPAVQEPPPPQPTIPPAQPPFNSGRKVVSAAPVHPEPAPAAPQSKPASPPESHQATASVPSTGAAAIQQNWSHIRTTVKKLRRQTEALLNSCKSISVKNNVLVLGFASEVLKSKMELNDNLEVTRQAIKETLGVDIKITCAVVSNKAKTAPEDLGVDGDGIVAVAISEGGQVVHKD
jgi:DNA polymerase-3 subunit gamma/tau